MEARARACHDHERMRLGIVAVIVSSLVHPALADRPAGGAGRANRGLVVALSGPEKSAAKAPVTLTLSVTNTSDRPIDIVKRPEQFTLALGWPTPSREGCVHPGTGTRRVGFGPGPRPNRGQLAPRPEPLAPGESYQFEVDLATATTLEPGAYQARVRFGKSASAVLGFVVDGTPPRGRCHPNPGWTLWGSAL